jgi:hypothetical protein
LRMLVLCWRVSNTFAAKCLNRARKGRTVTWSRLDAGGISLQPTHWPSSLVIDSAGSATLSSGTSDQLLRQRHAWPHLRNCIRPDIVSADDDSNLELLKSDRHTFQNQMLSISGAPVDPRETSRSKARPAFIEPKAASSLAACFVRWGLWSDSKSGWARSNGSSWFFLQSHALSQWPDFFASRFPAYDAEAKATVLSRLRPRSIAFHNNAPEASSVQVGARTQSERRLQVVD